MGDLKQIFVIVPVFNESAVIGKTLTDLEACGYSVVAVDDGSRDETQAVLKNHPVHRLKHKVNLGQGAALQTGMSYALQQGAQVLVHFDADGQHQTEDIETLVKPILEGRTEMTLGSRFLRAQDEKEVPFSRRVLLRAAVFVNYIITGVLLSDAHNGLRALSREAASQIHLYENGYSHASEIVGQMKSLKIKYQEHPVRVRYTQYSKAKQQSFWNGFNIVIDMLLRGIFR